MSEDSDGDSTWELVMLCANITIYSGYHIYFFIKMWRYPLNTAAGQNTAVRRIWCEHVQRAGKDVLVIQTLRNSMMSSSLLATTSLTLSSLVAAFFIRSEGLSKIEQMHESASNLLSVVHKLFSMVILFMISFICYMQAIRRNNHAGYMLTIPKDLIKDLVPVETMSGLLFKANLYHTIGTRFFYAAFMALIFIFGIWPLTISTVGLTILLFATDSCKNPAKNQSSDLDNGDILNKVVVS
jgi:hypothetical protein